MKNISIANIIEVVNMAIQSGLIYDTDEISAGSSIVVRSSRKFLKDCQETDNLPTDEIKEVVSSIEEFVYALANNPHIDFTSEDSDLALDIVDLTRVLGGLKSLVKSIW